MPSYEEETGFEAALTQERPRLIRLCAWFSSSPEAAEDLAQETLLAAWRSREKLTSLEKLQPWTSAIARNVCLNWSRQTYREQTHLAPSMDSEKPWEDRLQDDISLELELDRHELALLLDRALSLLPAETARLLVEHYVQASSHAEIAAKMQLSPGTVAVRLQRGKLTLKRLVQKKLQAEASEFGLIDPAQSEWEQTNIWCLSCGRIRLVGRLQRGKSFALRCPACDPHPESIMAGLDLTKRCHADLLGDVKTYKPAYRRLLGALAPLYHQALAGKPVPCLSCGRPVEIRVERDVPTGKGSGASNQIILSCPMCGWASNKALSGLIMASDQAQQFWREYPRMKILPAQEIEAGGIPALLTRLQSTSSTAELAVVSQRGTFELLQVQTNVKL
jgi:RNA polymerase sigma factor (sigma-70 family)